MNLDVKVKLNEPLKLESIIKRTAQHYGRMLETFRPFAKGGELNERNLTTQFLIEIKNSHPNAIICQEFHIPEYSSKKDSAFVDAVVITNDTVLFIEAKRNAAIMSNFDAINLDIKKLNSAALKKQFKAVCDVREFGLPQSAYGVVLADAWKKSLTDKWLTEYVNDSEVALKPNFQKIASFPDYSEDYDLLYGVFKLDLSD
ncbi:hypothetical protein [uncultured Psychrosphaera sp.]|mgnify:FL=1|jgi:hypothetical protein|uniref:hypothetical protein n=1 Tax=uncultured Psychrosphaera sp. TaxID=1403522 RepID=UPI0030F538CB